MECPHGKAVNKDPSKEHSPPDFNAIPSWCKDTPFSNCCVQFQDCNKRCGTEKAMCEDRFSRCAEIMCERKM